MMGLIKRALAVFLLSLMVLVSGCIPTGQTFSPVTDISANNATIYVYRPYNMVGGANLYTVLVDNKEMGKLVNGAYLPVVVSPGTHKVELKQDTLLIKGYEHEITLQSLAVNPSYLRFGSKWAGGKAGLVKVEESMALPELEKCKKY